MSPVVPLVSRQTWRPSGGAEQLPYLAGARRPVRAVYTVKEVAELLSISVSTAYALVRSGDIPAERLGRRWVIPRTRFHAWLDGVAGGDAAGGLSATGTESARRGW